MECHIEGCTSASDFVCSCQNSSVGICKDHVLIHLEIISSVNHHLRAFKDAESEVIIFELLHKIEELNQEKTKITANVYNEIKKLNLQLNQTVERINEEIDKIDGIIKGLLVSDPMVRNNINLDAIRRYSTQEHIQEIVAASSQEDIGSAYNGLSNGIISNKISYFKGRNTNMITYNLEDFSVTETKISNLDNPPKKTSMCLLPNGNIFCYGSRNHYIYSGATFIIDESYQAKYLVQGIGCTCSGLAYLDGCVYAFGGDNGHDMDIAQKYDLTKNEWVSLNPLEIPISFLSCTAHLNFIYYSGAGMPGVYIYNTSENYHQNILPLQNKSGKILFKGNGKVYLIQKPGFIYEQNLEESMETWTKIRKSDVNIKSLSYGVEFGNSVYFVLKKKGNNLYRFDLASKLILEEDGHKL